MSWMHTPSERARAICYILYWMLCAQEGLGTERRPPHHHHPGRAYGFSNQHGSSNGERALTREIHFMCLTADALYPPLERASLFWLFYSRRIASCPNKTYLIWNYSRLTRQIISRFTPYTQCVEFLLGILPAPNFLAMYFFSTMLSHSAFYCGPVPKAHAPNT